MKLLIPLFVTLATGLSYADFSKIEDDLTEETINQMVRKSRLSNEYKKSMYTEINMVTVNTNDQATCLDILDSIKDYDLKGEQPLRDLCKRNESSPYSTIYLMKQIPQEEWVKKINFGRLSSGEENLFTQTRNTFLMSLGVAGFIYMLPESVSNWDRSRLGEGMINKYKENVFEKGITVDNDDLLINWVGHPVSGAIYYQIARHNGYSPLASFGYSAFMSTFFWEFGVEGFAEPPSLQDLIITPVVGSVLGELFHIADNYITENNGELLGSKKFGSIMMFVFHPMRTISKGINKIFNSKVVKEGQSQIVQRRLEKFNQSDKEIRYLGLEFEFKF